MLDTRTNTSR